ncbi:MAG: integrase core domain-containing protein [Thermoplasmatota archaeon]
MTPINNNVLERFHSTWRERDKVMRGLFDDGSAERMLEHYRTFYNYIRPHMSLDNKTLAEVAGIDVAEGKNR